MTIDYARANREFPKQKARLTRATKQGYTAVVEASLRAVREWNEVGAWPDDWARWQRAIDDAYSEERQRLIRREITELPRWVSIEEL